MSDTHAVTVQSSISGLLLCLQRGFSEGLNAVKNIRYPACGTTQIIFVDKSVAFTLTLQAD